MNEMTCKTCPGQTKIIPKKCPTSPGPDKNTADSDQHRRHHCNVPISEGNCSNEIKKISRDM